MIKSSEHKESSRRITQSILALAKLSRLSNRTLNNSELMSESKKGGSTIRKYIRRQEELSAVISMAWCGNGYAQLDQEHACYRSTDDTREGIDVFHRAGS